MKNNLVNCSLTDLVGKDIKGITAQVRNPKYISKDSPAIYRELINIRQFTENKKEWLQLYWIKSNEDHCNFTGCTIESNSCVIQFTQENYNKLFNP